MFNACGALHADLARNYFGVSTCIYGTLLLRYPQGEASGDAGSMLNVELTHDFMPKLQGTLFYDYGHIKINHNNFSTVGNARTIAGAGVGVNALLQGIRLNSYVAWRTQGGTPLSEPASSERTPRLWVQVSGEF